MRLAQNDTLVEPVDSSAVTIDAFCFNFFLCLAPLKCRSSRFIALVLMLHRSQRNTLLAQLSLTFLAGGARTNSSGSGLVTVPLAPVAMFVTVAKMA